MHPSILEKASEIGRAQGLKFVYMRNIDRQADTLCPECRAVLIERSKFSVLSNEIIVRCAEPLFPVCGVGPIRRMGPTNAQ